MADPAPVSRSMMFDGKAPITEPLHGTPGHPVHVTSITFDFNRIGETTGNADHGYLTFHYDDGATTTLGGHPLNDGGVQTLAVETRNDTPPLSGPSRLTSSFELHRPDGMSWDAYAARLTKSGENYNLHPLPYTPIGEEGYNSTAVAASLVAHVGGRTGVRDLETMSREIGLSPHVASRPEPSSMTDSAAVDALARRTMAGRETATGLDHANAPSDRFSAKVPAPFRPAGESNPTLDALRHAGDKISYGASSTFADTFEGAMRLLDVQPPRLDVNIDGRPDSKTTFAQSGRLLVVNESFVVQDTGRGTVTYDRRELEMAAGLKGIDHALVPGNSVTITFGGGNLDVTPVPQRPQQQREMGHGRG